MKLTEKRQQAPAPKQAATGKMRDDPRLVALLASQSKVGEALGLIQARLRETRLILATGGSTLTAEASRVEAALTFAETGVVQIPRAEISNLQQEEAQLRLQEEALQRESRRLAEEVYRLEQELSHEFARSTKDEHAEIVRAHVDALKALDAVAMREIEYLRRASALGYDVTPRVWAQWRQLGLLSDPNSMISTRMRELRSEGY